MYENPPFGPNSLIFLGSDIHSMEGKGVRFERWAMGFCDRMSFSFGESWHPIVAELMIRRCAPLWRGMLEIRS